MHESTLGRRDSAALIASPLRQMGSNENALRRAAVASPAPGVATDETEQHQQLAVERDLEHIASDVSESALIGVTVRSNTDDDAAREISVRPAQAIYESIAEAFGCKMRHVEQVEFGDEVVEEGATYEDYGVEVGCGRHFRSPLLSLA